MNREHKKRLKELLMYAVDCSEYMNISEVFALPFRYRQMLVECINKHVDRINQEMVK